MTKVLIVEDSPNDLKYYEPLIRAAINPPLEVSLLFFGARQGLYGTEAERGDGYTL